MSTLDTVLPASSVLRVIKESIPDGFHINREAKSVLSRAGAVFAVYLAAAANDAARDGRRSTMKASDVLRALEDVELPEFAAALRHDLTGASARGSLPVARTTLRCAKLTAPLRPTLRRSEFQNEQARTRKKPAAKKKTVAEDEILDGTEEGPPDEDDYAEEDAGAGAGAIEVDGGEGLDAGGGGGGAETMRVDGSEEHA